MQASATTAATPAPSAGRLTHLQRLEAESIQIMRETVAEAENPVMLYSVGKDSSAMLHVAIKAFYPSPPPFPLMHVDTTWKFRAMYELRERMAAESGMELLVHQNPECVEKGINPFDHGSAVHTDMWKTEGLKQALDKYGFDAAFGGARRDEEKSRAKERVFSMRSAAHRWDPKLQRPELELQREALGDRLDHEVASGEPAVVGRAGDPRAHRVGVLGLDLPFSTARASCFSIFATPFPSVASSTSRSTTS